ncbi:MAG TPA: cytochrome c oxidase subunit II [Verrucomicrobiae bacterium]|jgi:cytochrome c oxidase subunit 2|nr:cytochrome c oxidase subunit II [Verrucomicrobiae bacterium]
MGAGSEKWSGICPAGVFAVIAPVFSPVSPQAEALSHIFVITLLVCAAIFGIVTALVALCILRFRSKPNDPDPIQITGSERLEFSWTAGSILILVWLFVLTVHAMNVSDPAPDRPADLTVVGHQWWWEVRYPNGAVAANEIHIPTGSNLLISAEAADVIHDLWVPQLGRKMDMIPGHPNLVWLRADAPGEYMGTCAEYCGDEHAWMRILVVAQSPADFEAWEARQLQAAPPPGSALALEGLKVFREKTCVNCHTIKGTDADTSVAPNLTHFASRETIGTGVLTNNAASVGLWLEDPQKIKPGCHMPNFNLRTNELTALTAYLETMK